MSSIAVGLGTVNLIRVIGGTTIALPGTGLSLIGCSGGLTRGLGDQPPSSSHRNENNVLKNQTQGTEKHSLTSPHQSQILFSGGPMRSDCLAD